MSAYEITEALRLSLTGDIDGPEQMEMVAGEITGDVNPLGAEFLTNDEGLTFTLADGRRVTITVRVSE